MYIFVSLSYLLYSWCQSIPCSLYFTISALIGWKYLCYIASLGLIRRFLSNYSILSSRSSASSFANSIFSAVMKFSQGCFGHSLLPIIFFTSIGILRLYRFRYLSRSSLPRTFMIFSN